MFENVNGSHLGADLCEPMNNCLCGVYLVSDEVYKFEYILMKYLFNKKEQLYLDS